MGGDEEPLPRGGAGADGHHAARDARGIHGGAHRALPGRERGDRAVRRSRVQILQRGHRGRLHARPGRLAAEVSPLLQVRARRRAVDPRHLPEGPAPEARRGGVLELRGCAAPDILVHRLCGHALRLHRVQALPHEARLAGALQRDRGRLHQERRRGPIQLRCEEDHREGRARRRRRARNGRGGDDRLRDIERVAHQHLRRDARSRVPEPGGIRADGSTHRGTIGLHHLHGPGLPAPGAGDRRGDQLHLHAYRHEPRLQRDEDARERAGSDAPHLLQRERPRGLAARHEPGGAGGPQVRRALAQRAAAQVLRLQVPLRGEDARGRRGRGAGPARAHRGGRGLHAAHPHALPGDAGGQHLRLRPVHPRFARVRKLRSRTSRPLLRRCLGGRRGVPAHAHVGRVGGKGGRQTDPEGEGVRQ